MTEVPLHPLTAKQLDNFLAAPSHALVLTGSVGSGKLSLATHLGEQLLGLQTGKLTDHAYAKFIRITDKPSIGIEAIRELEHFLSLKVPSQKPLSRVVIIEDSHLLTHEAQTALLKTLEEPPADTVLILTVAHEQALLPTIRSRTQQVTVKRPASDLLQAYFISEGFPVNEVKQALAISGGLPGLAHSMLSNEDHPLLPATLRARKLLNQSPFERLAQVEELSKQKALCFDILFIMQQMAHVSLQNSSGAVARRWQTILESAYEANRMLLASGQPKLVLSDLFLKL